jgi:hypothetical protein
LVFRLSFRSIGGGFPDGAPLVARRRRVADGYRSASSAAIKWDLEGRGKLPETVWCTPLRGAGRCHSKGCIRTAQHGRFVVASLEPNVLALCCARRPERYTEPTTSTPMVPETCCSSASRRSKISLLRNGSRYEAPILRMVRSTIGRPDHPGSPGSLLHGTAMNGLL